MFRKIKLDFYAILERDPAVRSRIEAALCYPGFHALVLHRFAHPLYCKKLTLLSRLISHLSRFLTGLEIHPGAKIGEGVFIDHGIGVVIGETTEIGNNVTIYQGVTLGGTGKEKGKRHPTIRDNVIIGAGAKILGNIEIGACSRIGAGSVILKPVPPCATAVGVPGRIVIPKDQSIKHAPVVNLEHGDLPDPIVNMLNEMRTQIGELRKELEGIKESSKNKKQRKV